MSKTKGNVVDPLDVIDQYGTDALRFTMAALAAQGRDVKWSNARCEGYRNFATKLWNAARFCEMNGCALDLSFKPESAKHVMNRWILSELNATAKAAAAALDAYKFNDAAAAVYQFSYGTFGDWYIEFTKPLISGSDEAVKAEVRATTGWVLDKLLLLLNPFMPYITEELHAHLAGRDDQWLMTSNWPEINVSDKAAQEEVNWVVRLISEIRSVRSDMNVPASAKIKMLLKGASADNATRLKKYNDIILRLARLETAEVFDGVAPKGSVQAVIGEASIILPIADVVDIAQERARLQKAIEKVTQDIEKINKMLSSPAFLAKAPEEVVAEQRETMRDAETAREKLSAALKQIA